MKMKKDPANTNGREPKSKNERVEKDMEILATSKKFFAKNKHRAKKRHNHTSGDSPQQNNTSHNFVPVLVQQSQEQQPRRTGRF